MTNPTNASQALSMGYQKVHNPALLSGYSEGQIWRDPASSAIYARSSASSGPPAGYGKITSPSQLTGYKENDLWRDPSSSNIYAKGAAAASAPAPAPVQAPAPAPVQAPPAGYGKITNPSQLTGYAENQ